MGKRAKLESRIPETNKENSASQTRKAGFAQSTNFLVDQILFLQRAVGNESLERLLKSGVIQAKLTIGRPNDIYEQEADRVAEQVMRMPDPSTAEKTTLPHQAQVHNIQRVCTECEEELQRQPIEEEEEEVLQTKKASSQSPQVTSDVESTIYAKKGGGQPLPESSRSFFEPRFGVDFSNVRVHTGSESESLNRSLNARAFTTGRDIFFRNGEYSPNSSGGKRLLAHELTHVVQQSGSAQLKPQLERQDAQETGEFLGRRESNPALSNVVQCQEELDEAGLETVVVSVIDAMSESTGIAGVGDVDKAFGILNKYSIPALLRVLAEVYGRGYFHGLLGYLAPGTKASNEVIIAVRLIQCQKEPDNLKLEEIEEAQNYIEKLTAASLPGELKPVIDCLHRERVRKGIERERARAPRKGPKTLTHGTMDWWLVPLGYSSYRGQPSARIQIMFTPKAAYKGKTITFLQTVLQTTSSEGMKSTNKPSLDILRDEFDPFYGADFSAKEKKWVPEGAPEGYKNAPSNAADSTAYLYDEPSVPPTQTKMFESVAVVPETGEQLGALRWGVKGGRNKGEVLGAESKDCTDAPSAEFRAAVERFYATPAKLEFKGGPPGEERYAAILDGFIANGATLSARHREQLEPVAEQLKLKKFANMRAKVGGFADASETEPFGVSERRADAVKSYLIGQGVPKEKIEVVGFGATWVRYPSGNKENHNRRVQVLLYFP